MYVVIEKSKKTLQITIQIGSKTIFKKVMRTLHDTTPACVLSLSYKRIQHNIAEFVFRKINFMSV